MQDRSSIDRNLFIRGILFSAAPALVYMLNQLAISFLGHGISANPIRLASGAITMPMLLLGIAFPLTFLGTPRYDVVRHLLFFLSCLVIGIKDSVFGPLTLLVIPFAFFFPQSLGVGFFGSLLPGVLLSTFATVLWRLNLRIWGCLLCAAMLGVFGGLQYCVSQVQPHLLSSSEIPYFWASAAGIIILSVGRFLHAVGAIEMVDGRDAAEQPQSDNVPSKGMIPSVVLGQTAFLLSLVLGLNAAWHSFVQAMDIKPGFRELKKQEMTIDLESLQKFNSPEAAGKLLRYLASSPRWRLARVPAFYAVLNRDREQADESLGGLSGWIAEWRTEVDGRLQVNLSDFLFREDSIVAASIMIGANDAPGFSMERKQYVKVSPAEKVHAVPVFQDLAFGRSRSSDGQIGMEIDAPGIHLKASEIAKVAHGATLQVVIDSVRADLQRVLNTASDAIAEMDVSPAGRAGTCFYKLDDYSVEVWGHLNQGESGYISAALDGRAIDDRENEWVGWSVDRSKSFYFQSKSYLRGKHKSDNSVGVVFFPAKIEAPDSAGASVLVASCVEQ